MSGSAILAACSVPGINSCAGGSTSPMGRISSPGSAIGSCRIDACCVLLCPGCHNSCRKDRMVKLPAWPDPCHGLIHGQSVGPADLEALHPMTTHQRFQGPLHRGQRHLKQLRHGSTGDDHYTTAPRFDQADQRNDQAGGLHIRPHQLVQVVKRSLLHHGEVSKPWLDHFGDGRTHHCLYSWLHF